MRIHVLALEGVFDLGLSAVLDAFQTANELSEMSGLGVPRFDVRIVGVRKTVRTSQGFLVPLQVAGTRAPECVVVPAIGYKMPIPLENALERADVRDAAAQLQRWSTVSTRRPPGGWRRCSAGVIRTCCSTFCHPERESRDLGGGRHHERASCHPPPSSLDSRSG